MTDLDQQRQLEILIPRFYGRVAQDDLLGPIFVDLAQVDWDEHLPKLIAFWSQMVLGIPGFHGSPAGKHVHFSKLQPFTKAHFDRWIGLFHDTIDRGWKGPKAEEIKSRAVLIAGYQAQLVGAGQWTPPTTPDLGARQR